MAQGEDLPRINQAVVRVRQVRWSLADVGCDRCGGTAPRVWEAARTAVDLHLDQPVLLEVIVSVHRCAACQHFLRAQPPFLRPDATDTNRVVAKAVASVHEDGMASRRVAHRLARDFWVQPSERMIRRWGWEYTQALSLDGDDQQWVVAEFSGILCVDEVYQNDLALLVAVDPASGRGDRLVGDQLLHGDVQQADVERFLGRLRQGGIVPDEVITDASALYPTVLKVVWPTAAHQLCLFHETRLVVKAVQRVIQDVRTELPQPPALQRPKGRFRKEAPPGPDGAEQAPDERTSRLALVHCLRRAGHSQRAIGRLTGHSRMTIQRWLREEPPRDTDAAPPGARTTAPSGVSMICRPDASALDPEPVIDPGPPPRSTPTDGDTPVAAGDWRARPTEPPPPPPWANWQQVREYRQDLHAHQFLLLRHPDHLDDAEHEQLTALLTGPPGEALRIARQFLVDWFAIARDAGGQRRSFAEALARWRTWHENPQYRQMARLRRLLERTDEERAVKDFTFLRQPTWEATNNGAERRARQFRHLQAPCFELRTEGAIEGTLKVDALRARTGPIATGAPGGRSGRGRRPRASVVAKSAA